MTNSSKRVVFTGGHHNSALAVALELKDKGYQIFWLGHKYSMWGDKNLSAEYREVTASGIPFFELRAGKFHRTYNPVKLFRILIGFWQSFVLLGKIRPDLIVSFGSYLAVPVAIVGWILHIPVVTHEQTVAAVLSNQVIAIFSKKIFVTFESSLPFFPKRKTILVGLPLASEVNKYLARKGERKKVGVKTIFVTGGKQGAHVINAALIKIVPTLVERYKIIHQTGSSTIYRDFDEAVALRNSLDRFGSRHYRVVEYFTREQMLKGLMAADLVVGRIGAHAFYEFGLLGVPVLAIPYPHTPNREQERNAQLLKNQGSAEILEQVNLNADNLLNMINSMMKRIIVYKTNAQKSALFFPTDAKEKMVDEIEKIIS